MHEDIKKKIIKLIEKYNEISVNLVIKELNLQKELVVRVLEEMRVKDGLLDYNYTDGLVKKYNLKRELSIEARDILESLK